MQGVEYEYATTCSRNQTVTRETLCKHSFLFPLRICCNPSDVPNLSVLRKMQNSLDKNCSLTYAVIYHTPMSLFLFRITIEDQILHSASHIEG